MNWPERLLLGVVLLAGIAVVVAALHVIGVPLPLLPERAPPSFGSDGDAEDAGPPPAPPSDEPDDEGLLAELHRDSEASSTPPFPASSASPGPVGEAEEEADEAGDPNRIPEGASAGLGRDPLVDRWKAEVDPKDPGQLGAFLIATFTARGTKLGEDDLPFLLQALAETKDWGVRNLLLTHLERIGGAATEGIADFLATNPDRAGATRALQSLGTIGDDRATATLVRVLGETDDRRLREQAFRDLLRTKNGSGTDALLRTLEDARDPAIERYALAALSQLGGASGAQAVLRYARSSDPAERALGRKSLRDLRSPEAVPALTDTLVRSGDRGLRTDVLRTLGRLKDTRATEAVGRVLLTDPDRGLRLEAVKTLVSIGGTEGKPALAAAATADANAAVRRAAERALTWIDRRNRR